MGVHNLKEISKFLKDLLFTVRLSCRNLLQSFSRVTAIPFIEFSFVKCLVKPFFETIKVAVVKT